MKKAYVVRVDEDEGYDVVVFAKSPGEAKALAITTDSHDGYARFTDLRPHRFPDADKFLVDNPDLDELSFRNLEHLSFFRRHGWSSWDGYCEKCGLGVYEELPESQLDENGMCEGCREAFYRDLQYGTIEQWERNGE